MLIMLLKIVAQELGHIARDGRHGAILVALRVATEMREDRHVLGLPQRIIRRQRLLRKHVEAGAGDLAGLQCLDQRRFVDHAAARDIDQERARLHDGKHLLADDAARLGRQRRERDQEIELGRDLHQIVTVHHAVEARRRPRTAADADHRHMKRLADRREVFGDQPDAENADGLAGEQRRRPALPCVFLLRAHRARQVTGKRQHEGDGCFRHRRAMNAADIGDQHLFAERGQVDDVVDTGAERLDPFQLGRIAHHMVGHGRREAQQDLGVGNKGLYQGMVADHIDGQLREPVQ